MLDRSDLDERRQSLFRVLSVTAAAMLVIFLLAGIGFFVLWQLMERDRSAAATAHQHSIEIARQRDAERKSSIASAGDVPDADGARETNIVRFGQDYAQTLSELGRQPNAWAEMKRRLEGREPAPFDPAEADAKKTLEVDWSVNPRLLSEEQQAATLMAWERQPDADGHRWCLFADLHTTRRVAKDEFAKLHPDGK